MYSMLSIDYKTFTYWQAALRVGLNIFTSFFNYGRWCILTKLTMMIILNYICMCIYIYAYRYIHIYKITMLYTKKWRISCHINKSGSPSSVIPAHLMWTSEPSGHPGRKISAIQQPSATTQGELWGAWELGLGREKVRIVASESRDAYDRNDFNEPRLLHLPIHRNV